MTSIKLEKIVPLLSEARLLTFKLKATDAPLCILKNYLWNIHLSQSFYPLLHLVEVGLRNNLYNSLAEYWQEPDWFLKSVILAPQEQVRIKETLERSGNACKNASEIIPLLSFGFWTNLLDKRYEQKFWPCLLKKNFPGMLAQNRTRKIIAKRLNKIRDFRNRISHHQKIFHLDLQEMHRQILETLHWLEPELLILANLNDTFPVIFREGRNNLESLLNEKTDEPIIG